MNNEPNAPAKKDSGLSRFFHRHANPSLYLLIAVSLLLLIARWIDAYLAAGGEKILQTAILQLLVFGIPLYVYLRIRKRRATPYLRLTFPKQPRQLGAIAVGAVFLICLSFLFCVLCGTVKYTTGSFTLYGLFTAKNSETVNRVPYLILTYALLPTLSEELIFRGVLCAEYEKRGTLFAMIVSVLSYALIQPDLHQLPSHLLVGLFLASVCFLTQSLFAPLIVHFVYNLYGIFLQPKLCSYYLSGDNRALLLILLVFLLLLTGTIFFFMVSAIYRHYAVEKRPYEARETRLTESAKKELLNPAALCCLLLYIGNIVIRIFI